LKPAALSISSMERASARSSSINRTRIARLPNQLEAGLARLLTFVNLNAAGYSKS